MRGDNTVFIAYIVKTTQSLLSLHVNFKCKNNVEIPHYFFPSCLTL
jgi:hypothetical protein